MKGYSEDFSKVKGILDGLCATASKAYFSFEIECTVRGIDIISNYDRNTETLLKIWLFLSREIDDIEKKEFQSIRTCKYYPELRRQPLIIDNLLNELGIILKGSKGDLVLTCDIDWPFYYPRSLLGYSRKLYHKIRGSYNGDHFDTYQEFVNMAKNLLLPVIFFILPKGRGIHDARIFEKKRLLSKLKNVSKSYDKVSFGIHIPLVPTNKYIKIVNAIAKELPLKGSRTHYLRRDDNIIAQSLDIINSSNDYSAGYKDAPSTFYGTSIRVLSWKDYLSGKRIYKTPVYFMDVHFDYCGKLWSLDDFLTLDREVIQKSGFERVIIWHNDKFHCDSIYYDKMLILMKSIR